VVVVAHIGLLINEIKNGNGENKQQKTKGRRSKSVKSFFATWEQKIPTVLYVHNCK